MKWTENVDHYEQGESTLRIFKTNAFYTEEEQLQRSNLVMILF